MTQAKAAKPPTVTEAQKRTIACPQCGAARGKACRGSRIPGANTFGGGWGGPPDLDRAHGERRAAYLAREAARAALPPCAASMGCLCAGHARGTASTVACDTSEEG